MVDARSALFCAGFPSVSLSHVGIAREMIESLEEYYTDLWKRHELPSGVNRGNKLPDVISTR